MTGAYSEKSNGRERQVFFVLLPHILQYQHTILRVKHKYLTQLELLPYF